VGTEDEEVLDMKEEVEEEDREEGAEGKGEGDGELEPGGAP
jgi:hypothetical protein